jgi:MinD superfamily P-loop ATPase
MKQIVIISGKGGTGKTVITASFAYLAKNKVMADCDVDASDLYLLLKPEVEERYEFKSGYTAILDRERCIDCKKCIQVCRFNAIKDEPIYIDPILCEGCGVCSRVCPQEVIKMQENLSGEWFVSNTKYGKLVYAKLGIAEENSGKLVTLVREKAKEITQNLNLDYIIIDGPPGIGCPVIASISGIDICLVITEPTLSGIHDLERIVRLTLHFGVKSFVIINKYNLNLENSEAIEDFAHKFGIEVVAKIPFDRNIVEAVVNGMPVLEYKRKSNSSQKISEAWEEVEGILKS